MVLAYISTRRFPDYLSSVNIKYVKLGYHIMITHAWKLLLVPIAAALVAEAGSIRLDDVRVLCEEKLRYGEFNVIL